MARSSHLGEGGYRERMIAHARAGAEQFDPPWHPVVVTTEHASADGKRPWSAQWHQQPIEVSEVAAIDVALGLWRRIAPHPITLRTEDCELVREDGIVYLLRERAVS